MGYRMFAKTIPGPKYSEKGWACQDSSGTKEFDCTQAVAVADGHGSSDCFRSEIGSAKAIEAAFRQTEIFSPPASEASDAPSEKKRFSETGISNFKYKIWQEWRNAVKKDWDTRLQDHGTLGEGEIRFDAVSDKYKARFTSTDKDTLERYLYYAYGTTLIFAMTNGSQILLLQIGDGSCVVLQKDGDFRMPVPSDDGNFLHVTVSLCEENSNRRIRHAVLNCDPESPTMPVAIFLSSDGLDDCYPYFENEQYLYRVYAILVESMLKAGFDTTEAEIADRLLPRMTTKSSRDDISLAYLVCDDMEALREAFECIDSCYKTFDTAAPEEPATEQDSQTDSTAAPDAPENPPAEN